MTMTNTIEKKPPDAFVTSSGDRIPLDRKYGDAIGKYVRHDRPSELYNVQYQKMVEPLRLGPFMYKYYEACWIYDTMRKSGVGLKFNSMLDLGSGFAGMPRATHLMKYARNVTAMDLYPYGKTALTGLRTWWMLAALAIIDKLGIRNVRGPMNKWDMWASRENYKIPPVFGHGKYEYLVDDIYKHQGQYDWINSSLTLTHFDHRKLFPRIAELLTDGGIFTFTVECWWYPVNSTQIVGFAPYICQRLPREEVLRYFRENHPDLDQGKIAEVYDYYVDKPPPTASTYIETAASHGLHPVLLERHFNPNPANKRSAIPPAYLERETCQGPRHVLEDIRKFRDDVSLEDLYTSHYLLGFRKVAVA